MNLFNLYRATEKLKICFTIACSIFNLFGLLQLLKGNSNWKGLLIIAIFFLGASMIVSSISNIFKLKIIKTTLNKFLNSKNIFNYKILKTRKNIILIESEDKLFTLEYHILKEEILYLISLAEVNWEITSINTSNELKTKNINYLPNWEEPVWNKKDEN